MTHDLHTFHQVAGFGLFRRRKDDALFSYELDCA